MKRLTFYVICVFLGITLSLSAQAQGTRILPKILVLDFKARHLRLVECQFSLYRTGTCVSSNGWTFYSQ